MNPTFRSLNKAMTLCGCERRLFICGLFVGFGWFATFGSVIVGLTTFAIFAILGYFKAKDPIMLRLIFNPGRYKAHYDAAKREPFHVSIHR